jgi:hypothetical protein
MENENFDVILMDINTIDEWFETKARLRQKV